MATCTSALTIPKEVHGAARLGAPRRSSISQLTQPIANACCKRVPWPNCLLVRTSRCSGVLRATVEVLPASLVKYPARWREGYKTRRFAVRKGAFPNKAALRVKASAEGGTDTSGSQGAAPAAADADNNNDPPPAWPAYAGWMSALAIFGACFAAAVTADTHMDRLARLALSASSASSAAGTCLMPPFLLATVGAAVLGFIAVRVLTKVKAGQVVRLEGPSSHLASKSGTPTLGGISFIPVAAAVAVWWCQVSGVQGSQVGLVTALAAVTCAYGAIGLADDWASLRRRKNEGLSPRTKLLLQLLAGEFFLYWFSKTSLFASVGTTIKLVNGWSLPLGPLYWPFALFTMTAMSNGVNLTDGLDGLAAGVSAAALMAFAVMSLPLAAGTSVFSAALAGGCCGFLVHNRHKATMFMGDTGSLALGGALGAIAVSTGQLFPLLLASGVYLAETLSVILQVWYYKSTKGPDGKGKGLLRMAPLHHHFELSGWPETLVVTVFYAAGILLALLACWVGLKL